VVGQFEIPEGDLRVNRFRINNWKVPPDLCSAARLASINRRA